MTHPDPSGARAVFDRQLDCLGRRDLDGLLENYHPNAVLLRFDGVFSGPDRIRDAFASYFTLEPRLLELRSLVEFDGTILYRAAMEIGGRRKETVGVMMLRNGMIWRQTAGVLDG
ncbi:nuclear transport factor 2 family protein [Kitasatospora sp. NPDC048722]|uniref:nuclear transport factor 2 family protein n=1 Tax=Kitasatospora sp. NPDC048722 TaxID=3155639 RepID=UPI0033DD39E9